MEQRFKTNTSFKDWAEKKSHWPVLFFLKGRERLQRETSYFIKKLEDYFNDNLIDNSMFKEGDVYYLQDSHQCLEELPFEFKNGKLVLINSPIVIGYLETVIIAGYITSQTPKEFK